MQGWAKAMSEVDDCPLVLVHALFQVRPAAHLAKASGLRAAEYRAMSGALASSL